LSWPWGRIVSYAVLSAVAVAVLVPVLWMVSTAFKNDTELFSSPPRWIPDEPTFAAFIRVWSDYPFAQYFSNSIVVVGASTLIALVFSALAGYGMSRFEFRGRGSFMTFLLMTQMFPSIMLLIPFYRIIQTLGMINTLSGLIITYVSFTVPFCSWLMHGYFKSIPKELDEAAALDGLSRLRTFAQVILPLALPGMAATGIYSFITGWNEYVFALVLTQSEGVKTVPVGIGQLIGQYRILWNDMMAASLYAVIPLVLVFIFLQRYLISSLTAGAVKS
jgi:ABC-type glycerol-3-phosphate transport system permease component